MYMHIFIYEKCKEVHFYAHMISYVRSNLSTYKRPLQPCMQFYVDQNCKSSNKSCLRIQVI